MKFYKKHLSILTGLIFIINMSIGNIYAAIPWLHVDGNKIKDPSGNTVILRGLATVDIGAHESWYGGLIALIDRVTNKNDSQGSSPGWYPKVIRLAVVPLDSGFESPFGFVAGNDDFYNDLLRPAVDHCAQKDIYAIIDWHYIDDCWNKDSQTKEFWEYIAPKFANDSHVLFEVFNEPVHETGEAEEDRWLGAKDYLQNWVDIIRSKAPDNLILVGTTSWCSNVGPAATYPISGDNIVYIAHTYPKNFSDNDPNFKQWTIDHITTCAAVHPVMMTEWGFSQSYYQEYGDEIVNGTISNYGEPLKELVEQYGIGWTA